MSSALRSHKGLLSLIPVLFLLSTLQAQTEKSGSRVDVSRLGPQVGERVPDFALLDQTGKSQSLQSIMGRRGAMLVFIRSADW
jgi:hypothetical protein